MGLTQYEEFIYWTDTEAKTIQRANKLTGGNFTVIQKDINFPTDISVVHQSRQSGNVFDTKMLDLMIDVKGKV